MSAFELVRAEAANCPIAVLCELLSVSRSGYYAWCRRDPSERQNAELRVTTKLRAIHSLTGGVYGARRMVKELDEPVGRHRVARLMRDNALLAQGAKRFRVTTDSKHDRPIAPNLLAQDFRASAPSRIWVGDITYVWTAEGWSYLAVLLDLFSRRVVGWAVADHMRRELPMTALSRAFEARQPAADLIHHIIAIEEVNTRVATTRSCC